MGRRFGSRAGYEMPDNEIEAPYRKNQVQWHAMLEQAI